MTRLVDVNRAACIEVICGSSGSGKSHYVKSKIKSAKRLIVYDPDNEYGEIKNIHTAKDITTLLSLLKSHMRGFLKVRFVPPPVDQNEREKLFNLFCMACFSWCNCIVVAEELAGVTKPAKAPAGWHTLVSRGRKRGISIYAVMQRPAETDKTVMGNASAIQAGLLTRAADRKYLAAELDCTVNDLTSLGEYEYIRREVRKGLIYKSKVGTRKKTPIGSKNIALTG